MITLDRQCVKYLMNDLINPKTPEYLALKSKILSPKFLWQYSPINVPGGDPEYNNFGFYTHCVLSRNKNVKKETVHLRETIQIYKQILDHNDIELQKPFRISFNATHPTYNNTIPSPPHVDHNYPHRNMIIYLTPTYNGHTIVNGEPQPREEDDIILFSGEHHLYPPQSNRRVVIVITLP